MEIIKKPIQKWWIIFPKIISLFSGKRKIPTLVKKMVKMNMR
ncbi:MAG: hypothetical protein NTU97_04225 [Candidatus Magasanikbacteria bacterium]|nr:hypothetical protein [Candidatus Magasanikbacteria bacterium]